MGSLRGSRPTAASQAAEHLQELLGETREVWIKQIFGGLGVFLGERMLVQVDSPGDIEFKVYDRNRAAYESTGSLKHSRMPYFQVPSELLKDRQQVVA